MRLIVMSLCAAVLAAAPATAKEGNPVTGVGVSVESTPGGITTRYNDANDAKAACIAARGTFSDKAGKLVCFNSSKPLAAPPVTITPSKVKAAPR